MIWRYLERGEVFEKGDEWFDGVLWKPVPEDWVGGPYEPPNLARPNEPIIAYPIRRQVKTVHLLCINDAAKIACTGTREQAKEHMEKMAKEDWEKHFSHGETYVEYRNFRFWHIHTIDIV